ncbi:MAG: choice-of-anchor D domain-containing protein, partial [Chlorobiota bacterium]
SSSTLGYCLLQPSSGQQAMSIYRTTDGGITWTPVGTPMSNPLPVALYAPLRSRFLFAICSGSQVLRSADSATTWQPILTGNGGSATAAFGTTAGQYATLTMAGQTIASLRVSIAQEGPILRTTPSDTLDFGTVRLDSSVTRLLTISNAGQSVLSIIGASIDALTAGTDEFQLETALPLSIGASSSQTLTLRFRPRTAGERRAILRLQTNATPSEHPLILRGIATTPSSVPSGEQPAACALIQLGQELAVECPCADAGVFTLELWSLAGTQQLSCSAVGGPLRIHTTSLPSGVYAYRLRCQDGTYFCGTILLVQ